MCYPQRLLGCLRHSLPQTYSPLLWQSLVRKAYSFSKNAENHLDAVRFFIVNHNLSIKQTATRN